MFLKQVEVQPSQIHGQGLFSLEKIRKGNLVYSITHTVEKTYTTDELMALSQSEAAQVRHFGYLSKTDHKWHLAPEQIKYCNHSITPNITLKGEYLVALRDIELGEELTQDYREFEELRTCLRRTCSNAG